MIRIFSDGSCYHKTSTGGYAALIVLANDKRHLVYGGAHNTTTERMELMAMTEGLTRLKQILEEQNYPGHGKIPVTILNDREDVLRQIGGEYASKYNPDLWFLMQHLRQIFDIRVVWLHRNTHPAMALMDQICGRMRVMLEAVAPAQNIAISAVETAMPDVLADLPDEDQR